MADVAVDTPSDAVLTDEDLGSMIEELQAAANAAPVLIPEADIETGAEPEPADPSAVEDERRVTFSRPVGVPDDEAAGLPPPEEEQQPASDLAPRPPANPVAAGQCAAGCGRDLGETYIKALDQDWHRECFCCTTCSAQLTEFYEFGGKPYCQRDVRQKTGQVCAKCAEVILTPGIEAMGRQWHGACFACFTCGVNWENGANPLFEHNLEPFCRGCWDNIAAQKCGKCSQPITDTYVEVLGMTLHETCFVCETCNIPFGNGGSYYKHNGAVYCKEHFVALTGRVCKKCGQGIGGDCISALGAYHHPGCFTCTDCDTKLPPGEFQAKDNLPYCDACV